MLEILKAGFFCTPIQRKSFFCFAVYCIYLLLFI